MGTLILSLHPDGMGVLMMDYFPEEGLIKCIDGIRRDESKIIAHCTSSLHPGPLTYQLMKKHKCIKKKYGNLRIVPAAEYWQQKKRAKEKTGAAERRNKIRKISGTGYFRFC